MIRKKQIEKAAFDYINSDVVSPMNMQLAFGDFINGVKWADRTMTEKACEWVENHIFDFPWYDNEHGDFSSKDVANALRKAMEE